jgi:hypothetical protein
MVHTHACMHTCGIIAAHYYVSMQGGGGGVDSKTGPCSPECSPTQYTHTHTHKRWRCRCPWPTSYTVPLLASRDTCSSCLSAGPGRKSTWTGGGGGAGEPLPAGCTPLPPGLGPLPGLGLEKAKGRVWSCGPPLLPPLLPLLLLPPPRRPRLPLPGVCPVPLPRPPRGGGGGGVNMADAGMKPLLLVL